MILATAPSTPIAAGHPTIWGLDPTQLHDRFWAARGVQVVRQGERSQIVRHAELFLLTDPRTLAIFRIGHLVDQLSWLKPDVLFVRLHEQGVHDCREFARADESGAFVRFDRVYGESDCHLTRVALTSDRGVAEMWQSASDPGAGWRQLRRRTPRGRRSTVSVNASVYERSNPTEVMQCMRDLVRVWKTPDATIRRIRRWTGAVWADRVSNLAPSTQFIGPVWVGAGRRLPPDLGSVIGPALLWDDPKARPQIDDLKWLELEPSFSFDRPLRPSRGSGVYKPAKRAMDVGLALLVLMATLPFYPLILLAIWLEDGRPFFFVHRRQTLGGAEFGCIKFRSMRRDAPLMRQDMKLRNLADGPQFFLDPGNDPRVTRVGRFLREFNLDELPQFINVLLGQMSVVGPRPSPAAENQFAPAWREARLSVRPGVTGLWQVMRTRRAGLDFQEWIRYDIQYVERMSLRLDLWIILRTFLKTLHLSE
jgi:lipopolysaccharide/colanic/teichoic acid biosynthesis glycosyltransferase